MHIAKRLKNITRRLGQAALRHSPLHFRWDGRYSNLDDEPNTTTVDPVICFRDAIRRKTINSVIEFGTAQALPGRSTHSFGMFPGLDRSQYTMVDIKQGPDVDVVADIHSLPNDWSSRYDACIANAVFEHLRRPWLAAKEIARILATDGVCHVSTHQTFPLHSYPQDFFRFSAEALALIFSDAGFRVLAVGYSHRTSIILPPELLPPDRTEDWNKEFPSYAIVAITAEKPGG